MKKCVVCDRKAEWYVPHPAEMFHVCWCGNPSCARSLLWSWSIEATPEKPDLAGFSRSGKDSRYEND